MSPRRRGGVRARQRNGGPHVAAQPAAAQRRSGHVPPRPRACLHFCGRAREADTFTSSAPGRGHRRHDAGRHRRASSGSTEREVTAARRSPHRDVRLLRWSCREGYASGPRRLRCRRTTTTTTPRQIRTILAMRSGQVPGRRNASTAAPTNATAANARTFISRRLSDVGASGFCGHTSAAANSGLHG